MLSVMPASLYSQCLIKTDNYRLVCADEVRYADSIASGTRLYISSKNAYVSSPRSIFNLVEGYGQYFFKVTNSANSQKIAVGRKWVTRIDSTGAGKALIYIRDINVTFTTTESYTAVVDSAIACFQRAVSSGLATLSDGDYGDVVVSGGGLVMTVDKPDLGLHNLADGDFSVVADSTTLSLTNTRQITLQTKNIDSWIARLLITNNSITLRTNSTGKNSRVFVDSTGANFQFVNGANNASLRVGDSIAVRFNTSGSVGQVLTVTSIDGDGRLVINPKAGGSGTANCEQTLTKNSHGFRKWTPIYWNGSTWARPTYDSIIPSYIVVDSTSANTFKVSNCGNYSSSLTSGVYYYTGTSPGYTLTQPEIKVPLFEVVQSRLILQPLIGFQLAGGSGDVTSSVLADTAAAIRADFPSGSVTPAGVNNSLQANNNNTTFKADTVARLGSIPYTSYTMSGVELGRQTGGGTLNPGGIIIKNKFRPTTNFTSPFLYVHSPTNHSESVPFLFYQEASNNKAQQPVGNPTDTTWNEVVKWGFNPSGVVTPATSAKPSLWYALEPNWYKDAAQGKWVEAHLSADFGQGEVRLFTTEIRNTKNNPSSAWMYRADAYSFADLIKNNQYAGFSMGKLASGNVGTAYFTLSSAGMKFRAYADSLSNTVIMEKFAAPTHTNPPTLAFAGYDNILTSSGSPNGMTINNLTSALTLKILQQADQTTPVDAYGGIRVREGAGAIDNGIFWTNYVGTASPRWAYIGYSPGTNGLRYDVKAANQWFHYWTFGGVEAMRLNYQSELQIGSTTDTGTEKLQVTGDARVNGTCTITGTIWLNTGKTVGIFTGIGTPEAAVTASVGSTFHRTDGGAGTSFYVKETGSGNTGWVAK